MLKMNWGYCIARGEDFRKTIWRQRIGLKRPLTRDTLTHRSTSEPSIPLDEALRTVTTWRCFGFKGPQNNGMRWPSQNLG